MKEFAARPGWLKDASRVLADGMLHDVNHGRATPDVSFPNSRFTLLNVTPKTAPPRSLDGYARDYLMLRLPFQSCGTFNAHPFWIKV
jgi:hypothetical protein